MEIDHFRYIKIQLEGEAYMAQGKEIKSRLLITIACVS